MRIRLGLKTIRPVSVSAPGTVPSPSGTASFLDGLGNTVTAPIIGQKLFINPGPFTGSPTSYDYQVYAGGVALTIAGSSGGFYASGDSYFIPTDDLIGIQLVVKCHGINASGASATTSDSAATTAVADIDLSADAPVLTRTSLSGATPYTVDTALGSKTYAGYTVHRQIASDSGFGTLLYDGQLVLTEAMLQTPFNLTWATDGVPPYVEPDNATYSQFYERDRIEAFTPLGVLKTSPWSATIQKTDAFVPAVFNVSDKSANITLSNGSLTATDNGAAGPGGVRTTKGISTGKAYWEIHIDTIGAATRIGAADSSQTLGAWWGDSASDLHGVDWDHGGTFDGYPTYPAYGSYTTGDTLSFAVDATNKLIWVAKNNTWANGTPGVSGGYSISSFSGAIYGGMQSQFGTTVVTGHFSSASFTYTPPSGFSPL